MTPPFANTGWPKYRVVTTAERAALQANQAQINNLPVGFQLEEVEAGVFLALWARDDQAVGTLRQLQMIPQANSVTIASLGDDLLYVEEYDVPVGAVNARTVVLPAAQRNVRLVNALMIYAGADGPADPGGSIVSILNKNGVVLVQFSIEADTVSGTIVPPVSYDVTTDVSVQQVNATAFTSLNFTQGDVGFRLVLTWKVVA